MRVWTGLIKGECQSKANSRSIVTNAKTGRPMVIKSKKARDFVNAVEWQVRPLADLLTGKLRVTATIYYTSWRPDLDESALLDALQKRVYENDRQIIEKHITRGLDKLNPRVEIRVEEIAP